MVSKRKRNVHAAAFPTWFLNGDPLNASEINIVVSREMTGIMRFRETGLLSYA